MKNHLLSLSSLSNGKGRLNVSADINKMLVFVFFIAFFSTQAFAQNGCEITGKRGGVMINDTVHSYVSYAGVPSVFTWTIYNTGGAAANIVSIKTDPSGLSSTVKVQPGEHTGSFRLKAVVKAISNASDIQECSKSVSVSAPAQSAGPITK